ncbi:MAG: hypothetical protein HY043_17635 [Verrucomicrobia bacterium]|nr:hypothetical protein [Verrucomicrobiota bacterium]
MPDGANEQRKLAAIMFTDMVGYSALAQRDEKLALQLLAEHHRLLRPIFPKFSGREIKTTGDGFLVEFASALEAMQCAIEIQRALVQHNASASAERRIHIRIGVHVGDVVLREADIFGDGVNIAARIEPLAEVGGICLSGPVYDQVANKMDAPLVKLNAPQLKNIKTPMDVYRVVLPWQTQAKAEGGRKNAETNASDHPLPAARTRWYMPAVLVVVGLNLFLFLKFGLHFGAKNSPAKDQPAATNSGDQKSIAVLPFVNMSADKTDEYLSDGMTEELLNVLTKVKGLHVPGRSSCFSFKGKNEQDIFRKVGEQLHVNAVLEGSVRKAGNQLRITAQLINVADGFHLWSETYDRDMTNIFAIQSDIATRVADALKIQLGVEETRALAKKPTENAEGYRLYLLGRYHFARATQAGWTNAINYYNQALVLDPNLALAYCGIADTYGWMAGFVMPCNEAWAKQKQMAESALAIDPNLAEAHLSLGASLFSVFDWRTGEYEIKRAIELNPNLTYAQDLYATLLTFLGRFEEATPHLTKAVALDPVSALINNDVAWLLKLARRYDDAISQLLKTLELDPNFANAHMELGWCYVWKAELPRAISEFEKAKSLDDLPSYAAALGYAYGISGNRVKAERVLRELEGEVNQRYVSPSSRTILYLSLGKKDKAMDWLEKCYEEQNTICQLLKVDPLYDSIRNEPRFQALLKKVGLDK